MIPLSVSSFHLTWLDTSERSPIFIMFLFRLVICKCSSNFILEKFASLISVSGSKRVKKYIPCALDGSPAQSFIFANLTSTLRRNLYPCERLIKKKYHSSKIYMQLYTVRFRRLIYLLNERQLPIRINDDCNKILRD